MKKRFGIALFAGVMLFSGCNTNSTYTAIQEYDYSEMTLVQLEEPKDDQPVCIIDTTLGTITAVLYPEYAPNTVSNFIDRINEGFYTNKSIYYVMNNYCFLTGAVEDDINVGVTSDGKPIDAECSVNLWPFKGAMLSYYNVTGFGDSRFFIINSGAVTEEEVDLCRELYKDNGDRMFSDEILQVMLDNEGVWGFSAIYTVFGQTIKGFDVIEAITSAAINEENYKPLEDININSIKLSTYKEVKE